MKKSLTFLAALLLGAALHSQTLLFEGFDNGIPSGWTMINDNHTPNSAVFQNTAWAWINDEGNPAPCVSAPSWFTVPQQANRWLISPAVTLPAEGEYVVAVDAKSYEAGRYADGIHVFVTTVADPVLGDFDIPAAIDAWFCDTVWQTYTGSLARYAGQTIRIALAQLSDDGNAILADNLRVYAPAANDLELTSLALPSLLPAGQSLPVEGTIRSLGQQELNSFSLSYSVNGAEPVVETITGLALSYNQTYTFTASTPIDASLPGEYLIEVSVSLPNGDSVALANGTLSARVMVYDTALTVPRTMLLEQFSTAVCGWCPDGHRTIHEGLDGRDDCIWIVHHCGFYTDALTNEASQANLRYYNSTSTFAPAMMVDRTNFLSQNGPVASPPRGQELTALLDRAALQPAFARVEIGPLAFDEPSRRLTGEVSGLFRDLGMVEGARLMVYLVEDSILMAQKDYSDNTPDIIPDYRHMNAVRASLTGNYGIAPEVDEEGSFRFAVDYTLPAVEQGGEASPLNVPYRTRLVAFLYHYDAADPNNCRVLNAAQSPRLESAPVGIERPEAESASEILSEELFDLMGRRLRPCSNLQGLPAGIYLLRQTTPLGATTQKIVVAR